jgi:hypothetical protein
MLGQEAEVKTIEKQFRKFCREQNIRLTQPQFEALLDVTHPKLIKLYWPVAGAVSTLREQGISGAFGKMIKHLRKGEQQ